MDEGRRKQMGRNQIKYRKTNKLMKVGKRHDTFNLHNKVKKIPGKKNHSSMIIDSDCNLILDIPFKIGQWEEYIK